MTLPYSRSQEYEADYIGLRIVSEAGYSPSAAIKFLEKLNDIPKDKLEFEFFSTHPSPDNRSDKLKKQLHKFQTIYNKSKSVRSFPTIRYSTKRSKNIYHRDSNESIMICEIREDFAKVLKKKK